MFQKIELRKTRDFSAKINVTFEFIRQNLKPLTKALIYITGPVMLLGGLFLGIYQTRILSADFTNPESVFSRFFSPWYGAAILCMMLSSVLVSLVVNEFLRLYETTDRPEEIESGAIWDGVKGLFFPIVGALLVVFVAVCVGMIFLVIPGIYLAVTLSLVSPIMIIERIPFAEAFSRSFNLITEKWWSTFAIVLVTAIIVNFMSAIFSVPQSIISLFMMTHKLTPGFEVAPWANVAIMISSIFANVGSSLLQAVTVVALGFQYYNLVERREARGLMNKLDSFGKSETNTPRHDETY